MCGIVGFVNYKQNLVKYKLFFKMVLTNGILCVILFSEAD